MNRLLHVLCSDRFSNAAKLDRLFYILGGHRSELLAHRLVSKTDLIVQSGPFTGMKLLPEVAEGCFLPKLLGSYEAELHDLVVSFCNREYDAVVNLGCAEGYYAVGLARLLPSAIVYAIDRNARATELCRRMAEVNSLAARVCVSGDFDTTWKTYTRNAKTILVVCDIEGAELDVLEAAEFPDGVVIDLLVETHPTPDGGSSVALSERFVDTHDVKLIENRWRDAANYSALKSWIQADQFLAVWEGRPFPTPWLWLQQRLRNRG